MALNKTGKLRKYHQIIDIFSTKKGTFDHKSTNQPKHTEEKGLKEFVSGVKNGMVESTRLLAMVKENDEIYSIDPSRVTRSLKFMMELLDFAKERWKKADEINLIIIIKVFNYVCLYYTWFK